MCYEENINIEKRDEVNMPASDAQWTKPDSHRDLQSRKFRFRDLK